jgi:hypothetical protein
MIYQQLRSTRVEAAQKKGEQVRDMWHKADWTKVRQNPESIKLPREDWLLRHDCERYVRRTWEAALEAFNGGKPLPREKLAAGPESDELAVVFPPSPVLTPKEESEKRLM